MPLEIDDLNKVYIHQLKDLHSAENQLLDRLPRAIERARDDRFERRLQGHLETTRRHLERIEACLANDEYSAEGHRCRGMEGLLAEAAEASDAPAGAARDALLIAAFQRIQHYLVAGYGSARAMAEKLGRYDDADEMVKGLAESRDLDRALTGMAERTINFEAMASS